MRSRLRSPMVSDHEHNWGQLGPGGCHVLRACDLPWSPIMSTIGANWGRVGVTRFGPVVSHPIMSQAGVTRSGLWSRAGVMRGFHALGFVVSRGLRP